MEEKRYMKVLTEEEQAERSAIVRGGCSRYSAGDCENYAAFDGMRPEAMRALIAAGFADPNDAQNASPTLREMLAFCEKHPGFTMHGYTIGSDRPDARVTVEGVAGKAASPEDVTAFTRKFRRADAFHIGKEPDGPFCYCWYD